ncbi:MULTISPECIES: hemolysin family protein [Aneurinibacillus]|jgi:CBS domain containing-hemolysin-like protein|uniref:Membrane protein n=1 Tax=Aneurinibacillus danicus TaxID=267746 RepID=A0A511V201_9BACL|nr:MULTISPECIES: hemolysin family protein [Aneurinibacillus]GEN32924.1 membrane protein [Aneurinibacillus danicus]
MESIINLSLVAVLIIATAFFVAAEFAVIKVRPTRINQLAMEGNKSAIAVQRIIDNLDGYLSACQLGITITALGLGWLGEPTVHHLLHPLFLNYNVPEQLANTLSFILAFSFITFLHVVLGELAPKSLAIQKAEELSLRLARPLIAFYKIMYPFIWALNGSAGLFIRLFGMKPASEHEHAHSEEELRLILAQSLESGEINPAEFTYMNNIFKFDERVAREIMVPRTEMACLYAENSLQEHLQTIRQEGFTRYPIVQEDKDHVLGIIHTKELFMKYLENPNLEVTTMMRPVLFVNEATPLETLLKKMQKQRSSLAILIDEYGGTSGLVTMEDILEEIVGEIRDEFDVNERPPIETVGENHYIVDNKVLLTEVEELTGVSADPEFDTVGGWVATQVPSIEEGQKVEVENWEFTVRETDGLQIKRVEIKKIAKSSSPER